MRLRHGPLVVAAVALLAHLAGLRNGFVYDDRRFITQNPALQTAGLGELLLDPSLQTSDDDRDIWRPLRALGHALDRRTWGDEPFGFHLHSLLTHVVAALLAFWALRRLLPGRGDGPALLGALALASHPLGAEAVDWVSSRGDLYAAAAALLCLGACARADETRSGGPRAAWRGLAALAAFAAALGKESAAVVPLVAAAHAALVPRSDGGRRGWVGPIAAAAGVAAAALMRVAALGATDPGQTAPHGGDRLSQVGWALVGTGRTLAHLIWPVHLQVEYGQEHWGAEGGVVSDPHAWLAVATVAVAVLALLRRSTPGFLLAWMLLAYLPSSSLLVTLRSLVNDRAAYPMLAPFGALIGWTMARRPALLLPGAAILAGLWSLGSMERAAVFHDERALWSDVLAKEPRAVKAHLGLAWVAGDADPEGRRRHLAEAARLAPAGSRLSGLALAELGDLTLRRLGSAQDALPLLEQAWQTLRATREKARASREEVMTASSLAVAAWSLGRDDEALAVIQQARADAPAPVVFDVLEGTLWLSRARAGDATALSAARDALQRARRTDPGHPAVLGLAGLLDGASGP